MFFTGVQGAQCILGEHGPSRDNERSHARAARERETAGEQGAGKESETSSFPPVPFFVAHWRVRLPLEMERLLLLHNINSW